MDKCSCLNPEALSGVLKTIYLFLEGQNFRATCETFLSESRGMGYAELKKAIACILVLKPSAVEVVKMSHADPSKTEFEIHADIIRETGTDPTKSVNIYYGEPLCMKRLDIAPGTAGSGKCPCSQHGSQCRATTTRNTVQTIDNTQNDIETRKILKRAVQEEVKLMGPTDHHDRRDKKINFMPSAQVIKESPAVVPDAGFPTELYEKDPITSTVSRSFPKKISQRRVDMESQSALLPPAVVPSVLSGTTHQAPQAESSQDLEELIRTETYKDDDMSKASSRVVHQSMSRGESFIGHPAVTHSTHSAIPVQSTHSTKSVASNRSVSPAPIPIQSIHSTKTIASNRSISPAPIPIQSTHSAKTIASNRSVSPAPIPIQSIHSTKTIASNRSISPAPIQFDEIDTVEPSLVSVNASRLSTRVPSQRSVRSTMDPSVAASLCTRGMSSQQFGMQIAQCIKRNVSTTSEIPTESTHTNTMLESTTRAVSTRTINTRYSLDYSKIKRELRYGCPSVRMVLLQALRWRITRACPEERNEIISDYARHDLLSLHGTPKSHKTLVEEFFCTNSRKLVVQHEEGMARMLNAVASLTLGRDYLCQDDTLLTKMILPMIMESHPTKSGLSQLSKEYLLVALQKLSLRNNMRLVMIQAGLTEYLVSYLSANHNSISDYCLEYCLALFMNLCLHSETHARMKKKSRDLVKFLSDFLSADHDSCLSYVNGAMYSLFMDSDIRKEAKHGSLDSKISDKSRSVDEEIRQQLEVILDILNTNKSETPCVQCECIDQDDEIDHLEEEIDLDDAVAGNPNGENLLSLYHMELTFPEPATIPLTCLCRPATPCKKITAFETCPHDEHYAEAISLECEKKSKKLSRLCFGKCFSKPKAQDKSSSILNDEENVLASEECPRSDTVCCPDPIDDECVPVRDASVFTSCSTVNCSTILDASRESRPSCLSTQPSVLTQPSVIVQESFRKPSIIRSVIAEESFRQPSVVSAKRSVASAQCARTRCPAVNWSTVRQEPTVSHPSMVTHVTTCMQCCNTDLEQYNTLEDQRNQSICSRSVVISKSVTACPSSQTCESVHESVILPSVCSSLAAQSSCKSLRSSCSVQKSTVSASQGFATEEPSQAPDKPEEEPPPKKNVCCKFPKKEKPPPLSRSSYVAPSFTRSVINNQSKRRFDTCDPCQAENYVCQPYNACYREPRPYCYASTNTVCKNQYCPCPNTSTRASQPSQVQISGNLSCSRTTNQSSQMQRSKYSCQCYNNMKSFVQSADLNRCSNRCTNNGRNLQPEEIAKGDEIKEDEKVEVESRLSTPEEEFLQLALLLESDNLCDLGINGFQNIDCECYTSVFQSRPKLPRTP